MINQLSKGIKKTTGRGRKDGRRVLERVVHRKQTGESIRFGVFRARAIGKSEVKSVENEGPPGRRELRRLAK